MPENAIAASHAHYWRKNVTLMSVLLLIWAAVGLGCGVLFAEPLNAYTFLGVPLGFWFAQQGSIATFVVLILIYAFAMNRMDARFHSAKSPEAAEPSEGPGAEGGAA